MAGLGVPIVVALILLNSIYSPNGFRPIPIGIIDQDKSDYSRFIVEVLKKDNSIKLLETTEEDAKTKVSTNMLEAAFVITSGFKEKVIKQESKGLIRTIKSPSSISAEMIGETIAGITARFLCNAVASNIVVKEYETIGLSSWKNSRELWNDAWNFSEATWNRPVPLMNVDVIEVEGALPSASSKGQDLRVLWGVIIAFLMFFLLIGTWWLADERRNGTITRLLCSSVSPLTLIVSNVIFLYLVGIFQVGILVAIFKLFLGMQEIPLLGVFLLLSAYILLISSIAVLVSVYLAPIQLNFFIPVFSIFTAIIGGCFWNMELLSKDITRFSLLTPQGWALEALNMLINERGMWNSIFQIEIGFLIISLLFILISYKKLSVRS